MAKLTGVLELGKHITKSDKEHPPSQVLSKDGSFWSGPLPYRASGGKSLINRCGEGSPHSLLARDQYRFAFWTS